MPLSYLRDDCHKQTVTHIRESRWFESMYTMQWKTRPTRHERFPSQFTCARCMLPTGGPRTWQPFTQLSIDLNRSTAPEKKGSRYNPQHLGWPIHESIPSFSPTTANEAVGKNQASVNNRLLGLPSPYHRYVIDTFNTCSRGATHRFLTDTSGGYNLGGAGLPHTTSRPSQPAVSTFHQRAPPDLHFNQELSK
jgi:hypothetical protein